MTVKDTIGKLQAYGLNNPSQSLSPLPIVAARAPTGADLRYPIGQQWIDQPNDDIYELTSVAAGVANWEVLNAAAPGSSPISKYIVDYTGSAGYTTIQAAINAAQAAGIRATVYVRPGTYTENLTFYDGIEVVGAINIVDSQNLTIIGMHTPPASGFISIGRAILRSATHIFNSAVAGTTTIYLFECTMSCVNGYTFNLPNWTGSLEVNDIGDTSTNNGFVNNTGGATIFTNNGQVGAGAANPMIANGNVRLDLTYVVPPIQITGAGNNSFNFVILGNGVSFGGTSTNVMGMGSLSYGTITTANTAILELTDSTIITGAAASITHGSAGALSIANVTIDSSANPVIAGAGAGVVTIGSIDFLTSKNMAATLTVGFSSTVDRISPYTVGPTGTFATIQAAINAAQAAGGNATVYVQPGTYAESLTLYTTIDIVGSIVSGVTITGVHTPPAAGRVTFQNCTLTSATDIFNSAAAGTTNITLQQCYITVTNGYLFNLLNWTGPLSFFASSCNGTNDGFVNNTGGSRIVVDAAVIGAGAGNAFTASGGTVAFTDTTVICSGTFGGASTVNISGSNFARTITTAGTSTIAINNSSFSTGATAAISHGSAGAFSLSDVTIDSTANPVIAGAGAGPLNLASISFLRASNLSATLTLAHTAEFRGDVGIFGDAVYRVTNFTAENDVIQAYAIDATAAGAADRNAIEGNLQVTAGNGNHTPDAVQGAIFAVAGANVLTTFGVRGFCDQADGSVIASTAAGVEGHLNLLETNAADLPAVYAFGVKGYLDSIDTAGVPAGMTAGIGSIVEYNTPFNAKAYGFVASRLNSGAGAGTAGQAAYGVLQGTVAIADWLYGLDLYNGAAGVAYTNADIRLRNTTIINSTTATDVYMTLPANGRLDIQLGDAGGVEQFGIYSSTPALVAAIDSQGDITGNSVDVVLDARARELLADGDSGAGVGGTVQVTNVIDETLGAGILTINGKTANPGTNSGFLKIYANANVRYIPYFTTISP